MKGKCLMCKEYHQLVANPQPPEKDELTTGRATPEEQYVLADHSVAGVDCIGAGLIPDMLEGVDPTIHRDTLTKV